MPVDFDQRLQNLRDRRLGLTTLMAKSESVTTDSVAMLTRVLKEESYQRRAAGRATKYALGVMQAVDPEYTQNSYDEGDRVQRQLRDALEGEISTEFRYQGSVPLDIHIKGISDIDMLVLRNDFHTYDPSGAAAIAGHYRSPIPDTPVSRMQRLRSRCETILTGAYPAAKVDTSGAKSITLSGGSLRRKVDVVPSHWHDTAQYQLSGLEHERGISILLKDKHQTAENLPFVHIKCINDKDIGTWGGTKKAIRLLKNLKNDSDYTSLISLSSYDIASLVWHFPNSSLQVVDSKELTLLAATKLHLTWCAANKAAVMDLQTPDGTRKIIDSDSKFMGLQLLSLEVDQLVEGVAEDLKRDSLVFGKTADERLRKSYIAA
jgi:hypothetical protein